MNKTFSIIVLALIIIGAGWYYYGQSTKSVPATGEPIKIGVILPLTGVAANYGEESQNGLTLAREDMRIKYPELNVELLFEDSFYTPKGGLDAYTKLKSINNIQAVVVGAAQIANPIKERTEKDGVLEIAIWSSAPSFSETKHNLNFRTTSLATDQVPYLVEFINKKKLSSLAILYAQNEFGQSYKDVFVEQDKINENWKIVSQEGFLNEANEFRTQLTKIKSLKADTIFFVGTVKQFANVLVQAKGLDINAQFVGMASVEDGLLIEQAGNTAEGLVYDYMFDHDNRLAKEFVSRYVERFGSVPTVYAAEAYVSLQILGEAMANCGDDVTVSCWKDKMDKTKNFSTIMGNVKFNEKGDLTGAKIFLKTIKNGQFIKLEE